jgi:hypothetical protein
VSRRRKNRKHRNRLEIDHPSVSSSSRIKKPSSIAETRSELPQLIDEPKSSRSLFHYTSAQGLVGILESQSLFATHSEFLNDTTECKIIREILLPRLEAELKDAVPKLVQRKIMDPAVLSDMSDNLFRQEADNMLRAMSQAANSTAPYFISSFCVHEAGTPAYNHGLLSQWRGYAKGGFAIEFDEAGIDDLNKAEQRSYRYQGIATDRVVYKDHDKKVTAEQFTGIGTALLKSLIPKVADQLTDVLGTKTVDDFAHPFLSIAPFLKHESFEEEKEYRIVALCNRPTVYEEDDERPSKNIRFRSNVSGQVIPYISLYEGLKTQLPIKSIIIGPHQHQSGRQLSAEILLEQLGLVIPIKIFEIPFRD